MNGYTVLSIPTNAMVELYGILRHAARALPETLLGAKPRVGRQLRNRDWISIRRASF